MCPFSSFTQTFCLVFALITGKGITIHEVSQARNQSFFPGSSQSLIPYTQSNPEPSSLCAIKPLSVAAPPSSPTTVAESTLISRLGVCVVFLPHCLHSWFLVIHFPHGGLSDLDKYETDPPPVRHTHPSSDSQGQVQLPQERLQ